MMLKNPKNDQSSSFSLLFSTTKLCAYIFIYAYGKIMMMLCMRMCFYHFDMLLKHHHHHHHHSVWQNLLLSLSIFIKVHTYMNMLFFDTTLLFFSPYHSFRNLFSHFYIYFFSFYFSRLYMRRVKDGPSDFFFCCCWKILRQDYLYL